MAGPLEQFEVNTILPIEIGGIDVSFTNASLFMLINAAALTGFLMLATSGRALIPTRLQSVAEMMYDLVANMIRDNVGSGGRKYFPFIFALFMFILTCNLVGMIPGTFTVTSHVFVTFGLAIFIFLGVTVIAIAKQGTGFLRTFFPHGAPWWTGIVLIPVELVSYLARPITLSVRLFANMTVGHVLLKVVAGFIAPLGLALGIVPLAGLVAITALEFLIAVIQAYVFTILTCVYLHEALHGH